MQSRCRNDATRPLLWLSALLVGVRGASTALATCGLISDICIAPTAVGRDAFRSADSHIWSCTFVALGGAARRTACC
jgi:hypothetical protein